MDANRFRAFEKESELLKAIAGNYSDGSAEYLAIRRATLALMYVTMEHADGFDAFLKESDSDPGDAPQKYLAELRAKSRKT
jgi:hypothetical protein